MNDFLCNYEDLVVVASSMGEWEAIASMGHMGGLHGLAGGLGDLVLNISAGHLGDGVAVLHLHGDQLHLGVVHAVLGGHLTAGVLHSGGHRVGNSVGGGEDGGNRGSSDEGGSSVGDGM